jgi:S-DNA-T family DNA segregation ATPase FtsK/SpoIIIE
MGFLRPANPAPPPRIVRDEIQIPAPKEIREGEPASKLRTVGLPILLMVALIGMVVLMFSTGSPVSPMFLFLPLFVVISMGGMMWGSLGSSGTSRAQVLSDRKAVTRGLGNVREMVFDRGLSMHEALLHAYPDPQMLPSLIDTERMWEVTPTSDGFTALRYGLGEVELSARLIAPVAPPGEFLEPVGWVSTVRFLKHHSTVSSMPVALTVSRLSVIGFTGDREVILGMVRSMLLHAAVTHGPDNLSMAVLTDDPDAPTWSWMKWLPHTQHPYELDGLGSARMMYSDWSTLTASAGGAKVIDLNSSFDPMLEIKNDGYRHALVVVDSEVPETMLDPVIAARGGVTWLLITPPANALAADEGIILRCDADRSVWRSQASRPLADPVKVAIADQTTLGDARTVARQLARFEITPALNMGRQAQQAERGRDWNTLMRVRDPGAIEPLDTWSGITRYDDARRLRIPIGFLQNGDRLELDIKQAAEGGTGPHGLLLGSTGSGKSEFLRNFVMNGCVTHSPAMLNWLLVDFKGGPTFLGMSQLPHVSAVITNMEQEAHLVGRLREMINGEIERRFQVIRSADELSSRYDVKDIRDYEMLRERGMDLPPLPTLCVVVDEWSELLTQYPDYGELFRRIGRVGRSVGLAMLLSSQSLENAGRTRGLEANIGYKIGLKTQTPQESRSLLDGSDTAFRLPGRPGHGMLLSAGGELRQFYSGFTGAAYFPPAPELVIDPIRTNAENDPGSFGPQPFTAAGVALPDEGAGKEVVTAPERTEEEIDSAPAIFTVLVDRLTSADVPSPYRMWLPALEVKTLDEVESALGEQWKAPANTSLPRLHIPFGLFDDPAKHAQPQWMLSAYENLLILGGGQSGKSTAIKTLVCSLAMANTPEQVQFYIVDFAGGGLGPLADLPHVGGVATRAEPDAINRILMQLQALVTRREELFRDNRIATMAEYRKLRTDPNSPLLAQDSYGDVYLVIDGWDAAVAEGQILRNRGSEIEALIAGALNFGVHLVLSTTRIVEMRGIEPHLKVIVEFEGNEFSRVDHRLARGRRNAAGQAITNTCDLYGLVALPRVDSEADRDSIQAGMTALIAKVRAQFESRSAERLLTLPTSLSREELAAMVAEADQRAAVTDTEDLRGKRRLRIALGVREDTLKPSYAEMYREPHLLIIGEAKSGKSETIGTVYDSITRRFATMDDAAVIFYDPRRRHLGQLDPKNLFAHVHTDQEFVEAILGPSDPVPEVTGPAGLMDVYRLSGRTMPPNISAKARDERSWWTGPEIFILVDDYDIAAPTRSPEVDPSLHKFLPWLTNNSLARGFHFVIARSSEEFQAAAFRDPMLRRLTQERAPTVILSAGKMDGEIGGVKFERFDIPGRARYVEAAFSRKGRIQGAWSGVHQSANDTFRD